MAKSKTPTFILELPLVVKPGDDRILLARLEAGRRLYNVVLDVALARLTLIRESRAWRAARALPKGAARTAAFRACYVQHQLSEYALHAAATGHKNAAGFADRLGAHETQKIGTRVWEAVEKYAFGTGGRPRFKGAARPLHSLEGKNNGTGIRWRPDSGCVEWNKLMLPVARPTRDQDPYAHAALARATKYCRVVWRLFGGERRWFVQLAQAGLPPAKYDPPAAGSVASLDIGPSAVGISSNDAVALEPLAPSVRRLDQAIRRLQRAMDRSRRAMNPDNYDAKGCALKGRRLWKKSARYLALQARLADLQRQLAAARKTDHGNLANRILGEGLILRLETLSYVSFQKNFGRSVQLRAPGMLIQLLIRKAASAGGAVEELNTWRLRMSQYDHVTDSCTKKPLSQRWHRLGGGSTLVQRDCYSAFLAQHASEGGHDPTQLARAWAAAEPLLRRAGLCVDESASGRAPAVPTVLLSSERIARRRRFGRGQSPDAVGASREPEHPRAVRL
jgi:putative transposase